MISIPSVRKSWETLQAYRKLFTDFEIYRQFLAEGGVLVVTYYDSPEKCVGPRSDVYARTLIQYDGDLTTSICASGRKSEVMWERHLQHVDDHLLKMRRLKNLADKLSYAPAFFAAILGALQLIENPSPDVLSPGFILWIGGFVVGAALKFIVPRMAGWYIQRKLRGVIPALSN